MPRTRSRCGAAATLVRTPWHTSTHLTRLTAAHGGSTQVRVRTTILMIRSVDLEKQTFTCNFFMEGTCARYHA